MLAPVKDTMGEFKELKLKGFESIYQWEQAKLDKLVTSWSQLLINYYRVKMNVHTIGCLMINSSAFTYKITVRFYAYAHVL